MKKYIIVALFLVVVWGCDEDTPIAPDNVKKDTIDTRFEMMNGIVVTDIEGSTSDTIGNYILDDALCSNSDEYLITASPNLSKTSTDIRFNVLSVQEVEVTLETILMSQELIDSLESKGYGTYENPEVYSKQTVYKSVLVEGQHILEVDLSDKAAGAYLVRVMREGDHPGCIPIIVTK